MRVAGAQPFRRRPHHLSQSINDERNTKKTHAAIPIKQPQHSPWIQNERHREKGIKNNIKTVKRPHIFTWKYLEHNLWNFAFVRSWFQHTTDGWWPVINVRNSDWNSPEGVECASAAHNDAIRILITNRTNELIKKTDRTNGRRPSHQHRQQASGKWLQQNFMNIIYPSRFCRLIYYLFSLLLNIQIRVTHTR